MILGISEINQRMANISTLCIQRVANLLKKNQDIDLFVCENVYRENKLEVGSSKKTASIDESRNTDKVNLTRDISRVRRFELRFTHSV